MKLYFCLLAFLVSLFGIQHTSQAQTYSVSGKVIDGTGDPVENAEIYAVRTESISEAENLKAFSASFSNTAQTNKEGEYIIDQLQPGIYALTVYFPGKKTSTEPVEITDQDIAINFQLHLLEDSLQDVVVSGSNEKNFGITRLRSVEGVTINDAKKNEVVIMDNITANLATNNSRQIYSRVPGLNIWESDAAGVQLGIGGRGLSPNRNSNFNTRQNGYDIAADALGYPESYYTPPTQALKRIEIVRGAASLQYGTQFGGLLNFVFKDGPENDPLKVTSNQSVGSFGLLSTFNSIGGSKGKANYYGFYQYKRSNGWRSNSDLDQQTAYASIEFELTPKLSITPEYTYSNYLAQQPGGLTDAQFEENPQQSNRERNWFAVNWNLFALKADYRFSSQTQLNTRFFGLVAGRDALGNLGRIDRMDFGGNRDLLKDDFRNWGNETRLIHRYPLLGGVSVFLAGTRFYNGFTHRRQGDGSDGSGPDFNYLNPDNLEGSDFDLPSKNRSVFIENIFNITPSLSITPGVRFEHIKTEANGYFRNTIRDLAGNILTDERVEENRERARSFVFFGVGVSYKSDANFEIYANFSQNYRAINFNDIRVNVGSLQVDPDIKDERGFNVDLGIRGTKGNLFNYDVSLFHLSYQDRIGTILKTEPNPDLNNLVNRTFRFRTNIADANIYGIETFAEVDLFKLFANESSPTRLSLFSNLSLISAKYADSQENGIEGNDVELVPEINFKTGLTYSRNKFQASYQFSFVEEHFSDASNARRTPSAIEGIIPSYYVMDLSAKYNFNLFNLEAGVNNLADNAYFTRRATGYPGPGIIPSSGRSLYLSVAINL